MNQENKSFSPEKIVGYTSLALAIILGFLSVEYHPLSSFSAICGVVAIGAFGVNYLKN